MRRLCLVTMPFGGVSMPSLGLTQLREVLRRRFGSEIHIEILYLNHDFVKHLGLELYWLVSEDIEVYHTGFGDWFFRQVAFPSLADNTDEYFSRYYPRASATRERLKLACAERRPTLEGYFEELIRAYALDQADIVGFTTMFHQTVASLAMARKLKQANPRILNILGGANCRLPMGRVLAETAEHIDYVFTSLALRALPEFVAALAEGPTGTPVAIPDVLPGRAVAGSAGAVQAAVAVRAPARPSNAVQRSVPARALARSSGAARAGRGAPPAGVAKPVTGDEPPIELDYDGFLASFRDKVASRRIKPALMVETSRGCWWGQLHHCTFCGIDDAEMPFHEMQPERALVQFQSLFRRYPDVDRIMAIDYILSRNHLKTVVPRLNTPSHVCIYYDMKANMTSAEVETLSAAGIKVIQPGIESIATSTLKAMNKGVDAFQNIRLLTYCSLYDVFPDWNMLLGVPGQADDAYPQYLADIPLLMHLPPPAGAFPVRFDRYSPYFTTPEQWELKLMPFDFYNLIYPFTSAQLSDFAYHHVNTNGNAPYFAGLCSWYSKVADKVRDWQTRWKGADGRPPARLYLKAGPAGPVVFDSRSGEVEERPLGSNAMRLLELLSTPRRIKDLQELGSGMEGEVEVLRRRGWLFEEAGRVLSLVLPRKPPEPSHPDGFFAMEEN
jgi:ribosomal peptide maturation radical SAM protein 1